VIQYQIYLVESSNAIHAVALRTSSEGVALSTRMTVKIYPDEMPRVLLASHEE